MPKSEIEGRFAKGPIVIRIESFGDQLLVLPVWWGGYQLLNRRNGDVYEMMARPEATFTFTKAGGGRPVTLTMDGHRELQGTYQKLGPDLAPMELLLAGKAASAYEGFIHLGLDSKAMLDIARTVLVNVPSQRSDIFGFIRFLMDRGLDDSNAMQLAADAAVSVGDRATAKAWLRRVQKASPNDEEALSDLRMLGVLPTLGGWTLPFPIERAYAPPTPAEMSHVADDWSKRDLQPGDVRLEFETALTLNGSAFQASVLSYLVHRQRNYGVVLAPQGAKKHSLPILLELKGVSSNFFPLQVPEGILTPNILGPRLKDFVLFLPAVRGEKLIIGGHTYQSEGDPADSWDGAADDAIAFVTAGIQKCPQADSSRIVAFGKSRGGTVAMLVGERDKRVKAIVSWSGPVGWIENMIQFGWSELEMVREGMGSKSGPNSTGGQAIRTFFKRALDGNEALTQVRHRLIASSPIYFADRLPKAQVHYGLNDFIVEPGEGRALEAALRRFPPARSRVAIRIEEDGGHDLNPKISIPTTREFLLREAGVRRGAVR